MNLGAENRKTVYAAIGLAVVALVLVMRMVFSFGSSPAAATPVAAAPVAAARPSGTAAKKIKNALAPASLDPTLRYDLLRASEDTEYKGNGRNVFQAQAEPIPAPHSNGSTDHQQMASSLPPIDPGPPPPPPINLKFFGFASKAGGAKRIFLSQGEDVFIASEGDIVDRRYRVLRIMPTAVEIEDVLNNNRQSIPLTQGQG